MPSRQGNARRTRERAKGAAARARTAAFLTSARRPARAPRAGYGAARASTRPLASLLLPVARCLFRWELRAVAALRFAAPGAGASAGGPTLAHSLGGAVVKRGRSCGALAPRTRGSGVVRLGAAECRRGADLEPRPWCGAVVPMLGFAHRRRRQPAAGHRTRGDRTAWLTCCQAVPAVSFLS